jgi:hypothetical protein
MLSLIEPGFKYDNSLLTDFSMNVYFSMPVILTLTFGGKYEFVFWYGSSSSRSSVTRVSPFLLPTGILKPVTHLPARFPECL